jgi:hypothetical protein
VQSDLESNVSELDESASGHHVGDRISKEQIYNAYQKTRTRYHKYKGRYADLAKHYKELEREREKVKVGNIANIVFLKLVPIFILFGRIFLSKPKTVVYGE